MWKKILAISLAIIGIIGSCFCTDIFVCLVSYSASPIGEAILYDATLKLLLLFDLIFIISLLLFPKKRIKKNLLIFFILANFSIIAYYYFKWPLHCDSMDLKRKFDGYFRAQPLNYIITLANIVVIFLISFYLVKKSKQ